MRRIRKSRRSPVFASSRRQRRTLERYEAGRAKRRPKPPESLAVRKPPESLAVRIADYFFGREDQ